MENIRPEYSKRAYFYSIFIHAALILLMLNITVLVDVEVPQFYEMSLDSLSRERMQQIVDEARRAEEARRLREQGMTPSERVEVPTRRMIEIEEPTISVPKEQRITPSDIIRNAERQAFELSAPDIEAPATDRSIFSMDRKESFEGSRISVGEQPGTGIETGTIGDEPFIIEGEIKGRDILSNPLPEYPQGLNKNAAIRIRFSVLPDGTVSSSGMLPVRKEDSALEELSMQSLRLWRFSPLPEGDNRIQTGIITFIYRVE